MQGMVAGKRSSGKPSQRWKKDIIYTVGKYSGGGQASISQIFGQRRPEDYMLSEEEVLYTSV